MGRLLLVQPGPGAPDLLPLEAWQALARPHVYVAPDDPIGMRLADVDMPFAVLDEAASENLQHEQPQAGTGKGPKLKLLVSAHKHGEASPGARKVAERLSDLASEHGEITFVLPTLHGEEITRAVLEKALTGQPEVEVVMGRSARGARLLELVRVMARLRGPDGCPWDAEQTHESLVKYLLDETYELLEAIEAGTPDHIAEELGDLLLQVVFHAQMAADRAKENAGRRETAVSPARTSEWLVLLPFAAASEPDKAEVPELYFLRGFDARLRHLANKGLFVLWTQ